jgi:hypothetical protein
VIGLAQRHPCRSSRHRSLVAHWRIGALAVLRTVASPCRVVQRLLDLGSSCSHREAQSTAVVHLDRCRLVAAQRMDLRQDVVGRVGLEGMAVLERRR